MAANSINSFANIKISVISLILKLIIQNSFYSETRLVRLIKSIQKNFKLAAIYEKGLCYRALRWSFSYIGW